MLAVCKISETMRWAVIVYRLVLDERYMNGQHGLGYIKSCFQKVHIIIPFIIIL